jgi:7-cyano-7-deazaguanine reductase
LVLANNSELGKKSISDETYNPDRLFFIPREEKRREIGVDPNDLPFKGFDCWNHYEVSWLNEKGKPLVAIAEIVYGCASPCIVESKSLKLYFNSFNFTRFKNKESLEVVVKKDLEAGLQGEVRVRLFLLSEAISFENNFRGECIDDLDVACSLYKVNPDYLTAGDEHVEETLYSNILKSNCLVTEQPDWGSVQIHYVGNKIDREGLLKYLVSFRNHNEFHEQCIERIFVDIIQYCTPKELTVYGRYTRRGGLDINPYRSTNEVSMDALNVRLVRQ